MKKTKTSKCLAKQAKGITLIALVITIVVLLILAAVSITAVFGDNGLLQMAKDAKEKTDNSVGKEQEGMANVSGILGEYTNGTGGGGTPPTPPTTEKPLVGTLLDKEASNTNQEVQDKNGKPVVIPAGFTIVPSGTDSVEYADPTSPTVDDGIVIKDGVGNEFVWVPVEHPEEMYGIVQEDDGTEHYVGKLYSFSASSDSTPNNWENVKEGETNKTKTLDNGIKVDYITITSETSYREPDTVDNDASKFDSVKENGYSDLKTQLQKEFNDLVDSVNKYHGFYIGRYETSGLKDDDEKPIVQAGQKPTVSTDWYTMYKNSKDIAYKNESEKIESVTSSIIWGSQWDVVMNWFLNSTDVDTKSYVTNSTGWYSEVKGNDEHETGKDVEGVKNKVKNIYDMAGNVWEWTIEANDTDGRVSRGGSFLLFRF